MGEPGTNASSDGDAADVDAALWRRFAGAPGDDVKATPVYRLKLAGAAPSGFGLHLRRVAPVDRLRGEALIRDVWRIGNIRIERQSGASPWDAPAPTRHYADRLNRFDWLGDLFSQGEAGADRARFLVDDWIERFGKFNGFAWRFGPTVDRVWNWLLCGADLFDVGEDAARQARLETLGRQLRHIEASFDATPDIAAQWRGACVLIAADICLFGGRRLVDATDRLEQQCTANILPDGGHVSRSPERLLWALADLMTLRDVFERAGRAVPAFVDKWIPRMGAMVGFFRMGDGGLAPFNDGGEGRAHVVDAVLDALPAPPRRFSFAMKSGFQKLEKGGLQLVLNAGAAPERPFGLSAHAGPLGFELSDGAVRLVTSCGFSPDVNVNWQAAVRGTGAHSTLLVSGRDACRFTVDEPTRLRRPEGPEGITAKRLEEQDEIWLDAQHGGWKEAFGFLHRRRLFMAADGGRVSGEDSLVRPISLGIAEDPKLISFEIRFHLHPAVTAITVGDAIRLISETGRSWRFKTSHSGARLEPSRYLARGRVEKTEQIVISGRADPNGDGSSPPNCVRWAFLRDERR